MARPGASYSSLQEVGWEDMFQYNEPFFLVSSLGGRGWGHRAWLGGPSRWGTPKAIGPPMDLMAGSPPDSYISFFPKFLASSFAEV